ncbi:MAG TPA: hypothetical protein VIL55_02865 [Naasia sp.]
MTLRIRPGFDLRNAANLHEDAARRGIRNAINHVFGVTQERVPLEEAVLLNSGRVEIDGEGLSAAITYDTVYAVRQHEELTWRHAPGRTAKYVEGPMNEERDTALALIAAELRRAMR